VIIQWPYHEILVPEADTLSRNFIRRVHTLRRRGGPYHVEKTTEKGSESMVRNSREETGKKCRASKRMWGVEWRGGQSEAIIMSRTTYKNSILDPRRGLSVKSRWDVKTGPSDRIRFRREKSLTRRESRNGRTHDVFHSPLKEKRYRDRKKKKKKNQRATPILWRR